MSVPFYNLFQVLGVGTTEDGETVLVTADNSVLVRQMGEDDDHDEDSIIQTEYVVQGGFSPSKFSNKEFGRGVMAQMKRQTTQD